MDRLIKPDTTKRNHPTDADPPLPEDTKFVPPEEASLTLALAPASDSGEDDPTTGSEDLGEVNNG